MPFSPPVAQTKSIRPVKFPRLTLATAVLAVAIFLLPGASEFLAWDRDNTELFSWVTAGTSHLTHWNRSHLIFDLLAWIVLGTMVEAHSRRLWAWSVGLSAPVVSLFILVAAPDITIYRGLSGLDSALFVATAFMTFSRARQRDDSTTKWMSLVCLLALAAKITWEWSTGIPVFAGSGDFVVVPQAHLAGAVAGWIAFQLTRTNPVRLDPHNGTRLPCGQRTTLRAKSSQGRATKSPVCGPLPAGSPYDWPGIFRS